MFNKNSADLVSGVELTQIISFWKENSLTSITHGFAVDVGVNLAIQSHLKAQNRIFIISATLLFFCFVLVCYFWFIRVCYFPSI